MDHLDIVPGPVRPHIATAGLAIDLGRDLAENGRNHFVTLAGAARHERRAFQCAFFTARDAAADVMNSLSFEVVKAPLGIGEKRVSAVDEDVAFFQQRDDFADHLINRFARFDHHHRFARTFQRADEFLDCRGRRDFLSFAAGGGKFFGDGGSAIKNGDGKSF
jgi:hypothetical protein